MVGPAKYSLAMSPADREHRRVRFLLPVSEPSSSRRWATAQFEAELRAWVEDAVGPVRLERHKLRPWSTVWRAYADDAVFWAKQNAPGSRFEAQLLELLARLVPDRVVPVQAVDRARGLVLMPDQGEVLGFENADIATWQGIVGQWAQLQRELVPHTDVLRSAGLTELTVADSEEMLCDRAEALHELPPDDVRRLDDDAVRRIAACLPALRRDVEVVAALGLPLALNHNDLHGNNVFAHDGEVMRFFDLGDAMLTDPTGVLLVPLGCLVDVLSCSPDDPRLWQVAETWVEVWSDVAPAAPRSAPPCRTRCASPDWRDTSPG